MIKVLREYLSGAKSEFDKVKWPTRDRFMRSFITVVIAVVIATLAVLFIDSLLQAGLKVLLT